MVPGAFTASEFLFHTHLALAIVHSAVDVLECYAAVALTPASHDFQTRMAALE
jgi:hypothetical protein